MLGKDEKTVFIRGANIGEPFGRYAVSQELVIGILCPSGKDA
jgi:hypothetical protein